MSRASILEGISKGRTDLVFDLLRLPDWRESLGEGQIKALQWFVYYNDVTAHGIGEHAREFITSDHGAGWGNGMERNLLGEYLPESGKRG
jgi:hypothetical protein